MALMRRQSLVKFDAPLCETIVDTPKPQGREVLVRIERCGLCHSDLHIQDGYADLGGGRANVGVQATTQFDRGGAINVLFGQSYQLFGLNSFAVADATNTGLDSGLATQRSDYVARVSYSPNRTYTFSTRARFDEATMNVNRFEAEGKATFDRWSVSMTIEGFMVGTLAEGKELMALARAGKIKPTPMREEPMADVQKWIDELRAGRVVGRIVLKN